MTSIPDLASRPAFKLDMICQKLQQDTGTEGSELSPANTGETSHVDTGHRHRPDSGLRRHPQSSHYWLARPIR